LEKQKYGIWKDILESKYESWRNLNKNIENKCES